MTLAESTETMPDDFRPALRQDNLVRRYDNEIVAWSSISERPVFLDPIAAVVFQIVDSEATVAELITDVHEELGLAREIADIQIRKSLQLLDAGRLLETSLPGAVPLEPDLFFEPAST